MEMCNPVSKGLILAILQAVDKPALILTLQSQHQSSMLDPDYCLCWKADSIAFSWQQGSFSLSIEWASMCIQPHNADVLQAS